MTKTANPELLPSHTEKPKASHESCGYFSQLFFSSASVTAVAPTPGLCACLSTGSQAGTERRHFTRGKEHAETPRLQVTPSHTPPWKPPTRTQNLALCWPVSPSEGAAFTTKTQQHCPQMCREQMPRGPTCVSSKLLLGCRELASRSLSLAFWVRAQKVLAVWHNRATMYCWNTCKNKAQVCSLLLHTTTPLGQSQQSKGQFLIWRQWQACLRYSKKRSMLKETQISKTTAKPKTNQTPQKTLPPKKNQTKNPKPINVSKTMILNMHLLKEESN